MTKPGRKLTMLTEDYLMRTINQTLAIFLQALGLKKTGQRSLQARSDRFPRYVGKNLRQLAYQKGEQ
jgi:hypothetical protein